MLHFLIWGWCDAMSLIFSWCIILLGKYFNYEISFYTLYVNIILYYTNIFYYL